MPNEQSKVLYGIEESEEITILYGFVVCNRHGNVSKSSYCASSSGKTSGVNVLEVL